jgi:hypothetical protein
MGVNESHIQELKLVCCMQCHTYAHRKCNGIRNDLEAERFLCKGCVRNMNKQVAVSGGLTMDVLGPFYPEGDSAKLCSWTSAKVGYFIHTIGGAKSTPRKAARRANASLAAYASEQKSVEKASERHAMASAPEQAAREPSVGPLEFEQAGEEGVGQQQASALKSPAAAAGGGTRTSPRASAAAKVEAKGEDKRDALVPIHSNGSASDGEVTIKPQEAGLPGFPAAVGDEGE